MNKKNDVGVLEICRLCGKRIRIIPDDSGRLIKCDPDRIRTLGMMTGHWSWGYAHHSVSCNQKKAVGNGYS